MIGFNTFKNQKSSSIVKNVSEKSLFNLKNNPEVNDYIKVVF
jgi:hypothetical protein